MKLLVDQMKMAYLGNMRPLCAEMSMLQSLILGNRVGMVDGIGCLRAMVAVKMPVLVAGKAA
jgi:hypothetical protein